MTHQDRVNRKLKELRDGCEAAEHEGFMRYMMNGVNHIATKDFGIMYSEETGITESGAKVFREFSEILKRAGW